MGSFEELIKTGKEFSKLLKNQENDDVNSEIITVSFNDYLNLNTTPLKLIS